MRVALLIAAKDLRQRLRDRSALLIAVVAPLGLAVIFSLLLGGTTQFRATYIVADLDGGELAGILRTHVIGAMAGEDGPITVSDAPTEAAARAAVEDGSADVAFIIPPGFSAAIAAGQAATLDVVGANDEGLATEIARALAERFGDGVVTIELAVATATRLAAEGGGAGASPDPALVGRVAAAAGAAGGNPPIVVVDTTTGLRQLSSATFFASSMAILFLFLSAQTGLVSVFEERKRGTLGRILAGPIRPEAVLAGKVLGSFVQAALAMTVLVVATTLLLGASWGPPAGVVLVVGAAILAAIGVSSLVISFCSTAEAAGAASSAVGITLAVLGGTFSPTAQAPEIMSVMALATPHGWFLRGLGDMQGPDGAAAALPSVGVLLVIALVTGGLGLLRARRLVRAR